MLDNVFPLPSLAKKQKSAKLPLGDLQTKKRVSIFTEDFQSSSGSRTPSIQIEKLFTENDFPEEFSNMSPSK